MDDDKGNEGTSELAPALVCKNGSHKSTANVCGGEFGGDDSGQRVVTTHTDAHDYSPYDDDTEDVDGVCLASDGLSKGSDDDDHELDTVY